MSTSSLLLFAVVCGALFTIGFASTSDTPAAGTISTLVDVDAATTATIDPVTEDVAQSEYVGFIKRFGKKYAYDDFFPSYHVFKSNLNLIRHHNSDSKQTYRLGVNEHADLTADEWRKRTGYVPRVTNPNHPQRVNASSRFHTETLPASLDWRSSGKVTSVKNQQEPCMGSWAFSAAGAIEGAWAIAGHTLTSLSAQQFLDCDTDSAGCSGGSMDSAFDYLVSTPALHASDASYPYTAAAGTCSPPSQRVTGISSYTWVADESSLMAAVAIGPVSVALETARSSIHLYSSGVYSNSQCGTNVDYGALVVGWGTDPSTSQDYWIIKYSWGTTWGESGYLRLLRGSNLCGIGVAPVYPLL